jgi:omega-amidase
MDKLARTLRIGCVQLKVGANKTVNVTNALNKIREAKLKGAELVCLPECFNSLYGTKYFDEYAETIPGETTNLLSEIAKELQIYLVGGTIPERDNTGKLYNTSTVWGKSGELLAKYRKMHLFDISIPGGITFKESDALSSGNDLAIFDIGDFKIGLGICYDIRFEELAKLYRKKGCNMIIYPGAFNMTTGPLHWELLARGRAVDNQVYTAIVSPARDTNADYIAYGHSMVVDPWAKVIHSAGSEEEVFVVDLGMFAFHVKLLITIFLFFFPRALTQI